MTNFGSMVRRAGAVLVAVASAAIVGASAAHAAGSKEPSLQRYLSSMSWPMRASVLRVRTVADRIDAWIAADDPPGLGQIALTCRHLRDVESRGRVLDIVSPASIRKSHARLVRAYSTVRNGCVHVRLTALATRTAMARAFRTKSEADKHAMDRAEASARAEFRRFERTALALFDRAATAWRFAAIREAKVEGLPPPAWLDQLG